MFRSRKYVLLGATLVLALSLAPAAEAKKFLDQAKFKLLSLSGNTTLTWTEDSTSTGNRRCAGTTISRLSVRSTQQPTLYVFLKEFHGLRTIVAPDPDFNNLDSVKLAGQARMSRSVDYQETAGCDQRPPAECPEASSNARISGTTDDPRGGIAWFVEDTWPPGYPESCTILDNDVPFGGTRFERPTKFASAIPRKDLFDEKKGRLSGSVSIEEPLAQAPSAGASIQGTVTANFTDELSVKLKRLDLKKDEKRG